MLENNKQEESLKFAGILAPVSFYDGGEGEAGDKKSTDDSGGGEGGSSGGPADTGGSSDSGTDTGEGSSKGSQTKDSGGEKPATLDEALSVIENLNTDLGEARKKVGTQGNELGPLRIAQRNLRNLSNDPIAIAALAKKQGLTVVSDSDTEIQKALDKIGKTDGNNAALLTSIVGVLDKRNEDRFTEMEARSARRDEVHEDEVIETRMAKTFSQEELTALRPRADQLADGVNKGTISITELMHLGARGSASAEIVKTAREQGFAEGKKAAIEAKGAGVPTGNVNAPKIPVRAGTKVRSAEDYLAATKPDRFGKKPETADKA